VDKKCAFVVNTAQLELLRDFECCKVVLVVSRETVKCRAVMWVCLDGWVCRVFVEGELGNN